MEFAYKKILPWILFAFIVVGVGIGIFLHFTGEKSLNLISPKGNEIWQAGKTYQITWKARKIGKVGIKLVKDKIPQESEWIVKDFPAGKGKYDWQIFTWQEPRQDYKIAIFEYPWYEGNKIDYSDKDFTILGPTFASCDTLSIEAEWSYLPSDFPNLKKVFITNTAFGGNLGGLKGADQKCQEEAKERGWEGTWKALLGDDNTLAVERLDLEGIFVEAEGKETLPVTKIPNFFWESFKDYLKKTKLRERREVVESAYGLLGEYFEEFLRKWEKGEEKKTCYRLLGKNFDEFFKKLSDPLALNQGKFSKEFLENLDKIWLGRINKESKRDCTTIFAEYPSSNLSLNYSYTTTCQNWTTSEGKVTGYPPKPDEKIELPICYSPEGAKINAAGLAGLSSGLIKKEEGQIFTPSLSKSCNLSQKLLCIQQ